MQTINIFVAGSKRLTEERALFRIIASELQSEYKELGTALSIQIYTFETFDDFFKSGGRKQNDYNNHIKNKTDIVFFVLDSVIGGITLEEFNTAYASFVKYKKPLICVFSKIDNNDNDDIMQVREKITAVGQYFSEYVDVSDLKGKIEKSLRNFITHQFIYSKRGFRGKFVFMLCLACCVLLGLAIRNFPLLDKDDNKESANNSNMKSFTVNNVSFDMIQVVPGAFTMGGYDKDAEKHVVAISDTFFIGSTEVTQKLWCAVMQDNPSKIVGEKLPVNNVSWNDCIRFVKRLNEISGEKYRLPTEAEWEYVARFGGEELIYSGGDLIDSVAWFIDNSNQHLHEVALKSPNKIGVYDMSGNVWEWCSDYYDLYNANDSHNPKGPAKGEKRVRRGGSYKDNARCCQTTFRSRNYPDRKKENQGLRLVKEK